MSKSKPALPEDTKLDYITVEGVPTINIAASLTTRAQVQAVLEQLGRLAAVLPETKVRKARAKTKNGQRATRGPDTSEEKVV